MFDEQNEQSQSNAEKNEQRSSNTPGQRKPTVKSTTRGGKKRPQHMMPKQNLQRFDCPRCGKDYSQRKNMRRHLRLECGQEPQYPCPICKLRFKRHNQMSGHMVARHGYKESENKTDDKSNEHSDT